MELQSLEEEKPRIVFSQDSRSAYLPLVDCPQTSNTIQNYSRQIFVQNHSPRYQTDFNTMYLGRNRFVCYNLQQPPVVLNQAALELASFFDEPHFLDELPEKWGHQETQCILRKLVELSLIIPEDYLHQISEEADTTLFAWLHVTDRCNLRCKYCYLPHKDEDMSPEIGRAAIEATIRSATLNNYKNVVIKYAGGEPLLRFKLINELHQYALKLAYENNISLDGVILSNGTLLTRKVIKQIQLLNISLSISLDGLNEHHDQQRVYENGRGSFNFVSRSIEEALENDLIPNISVTISGKNALGLPKLMSWILDHQLPFSLSFYRDNEYSKVYSELKLEEEYIIKYMLATFKVIEDNLPNRNLLASIVDRADLSNGHLRTCNAGRGYLVFDHLGQISKCQMQKNDIVTTVEASDPLTLIRNNNDSTFNIAVANKEGCLDCEWRYKCTGGCPVVTYKVTGRYDIKSPFCNIYKKIYPEAVRLEGLRLLKYFAR